MEDNGNAFNNLNKEKHFDYGREYSSNELIFDIDSEEIEETYQPFDSCASAQILIKKKRMKYDIKCKQENRYS